MRVATLSCGAVVIQSGGAEWLFGAPRDVGVALKEAGLDAPRYVFTTTMRVPGISDLSNVVRFKGEPLSVGGMSAQPVERKHGIDYAIEADGVRVLFSERGDVATADLDGYNLAIIKNKNRADAWGDQVITWPWPDAEFDLSFKIYSSMDDVPANLKKMDDVALTLEQVNSIVRQAEGIPEGKVESPWAVAKGNFKKTHTIKDGKWVKKSKGKAEKEAFQCECISCGYVVTLGEGEHCADTPCPECSGEMRRAERPGPGDGAGAIVSHEVSRSVIKELETVFKAEGLSIPEALPEDGAWSTVFKDVDGKWCWAGITSTAGWDLQDEFVTPKAMDWAVRFASIVGNGPLRYRHMPGLDGGTCTKQVRVGDFLFERGEFNDSPIGQAMKEMMKNDPSWKLSPGLAFGANDLVDGVYQRMLIFERSATKSPANPFTAILAHKDGGMIMKQLSEEQLKQAADELGLDLDYVQKLHTQAISGGVAPSFKEFMIALKEAKGKGDKKDEEEEEEEEEESEIKVKALLTGLDPEQRGQLKELLAAVEEDIGKDPVESLRADMDTQFKEMRQAYDSITGALGKLTEVLVATRSKESDPKPVDDANLRQVVEQILSASPRRQAAHFASKEVLGEDVSDADKAILAKLEDIQTQVKTATQPFATGGGMYDAFTSTRLNAGGGDTA